MTNPWLGISEADYLGHMRRPEVGQLQVLSRLLGEALASTRPADVLYLGSASGNGLEHVDAGVTSSVTCIDINASYLTRLEERFAGSAFALRVECADLNAREFESEAFDLVHAALVLEYVDWRRLVPQLAAALRAGGTLSVVLQLPSEQAPAVTPTPFTSLQRLEEMFRFVDPDELERTAAGAGLDLARRRAEPLPSGKTFAVRYFAKRA